MVRYGCARCAARPGFRHLLLYSATDRKFDHGCRVAVIRRGRTSSTALGVAMSRTKAARSGFRRPAGPAGSGATRRGLATAIPTWAMPSASRWTATLIEAGHAAARARSDRADDLDVPRQRLEALPDVLHHGDRDVPGLAGPDVGQFADLPACVPPTTVQRVPSTSLAGLSIAIAGTLGVVGSRRVRLGAPVVQAPFQRQARVGCRTTRPALLAGRAAAAVVAVVAGLAALAHAVAHRSYKLHSSGKRGSDAGRRDPPYWQVALQPPWLPSSQVSLPSRTPFPHSAL